MISNSIQMGSIRAGHLQTSQAKTLTLVMIAAQALTLVMIAAKALTLVMIAYLMWRSRFIMSQYKHKKQGEVSNYTKNFR